MQQTLFQIPPISVLLKIIAIAQLATHSLSLCRDSCGEISIRYPFGLDIGCGFYAFQGLLDCNGTVLSLISERKSDMETSTDRLYYPVRSINYENNTMIVDPGMLTCSGTSLGSSNLFELPEEISSTIAPSYNTFFGLLGCTNSPFLDKHCFSTVSSYRCQDLYSCPSLSNTPLPSPSKNCCFTRYGLLKSINFNLMVAGCSRVVSVYGFSGDVLYWGYGVELSFSHLDLGCDSCKHSGGVCGYDNETMIPICMCPNSISYTTACDGSMGSSGANRIISISQISNELLLVAMVTLIPLLL